MNEIEQKINILIFPLDKTLTKFYLMASQKVYKERNGSRQKYQCHGTRPGFLLEPGRRDLYSAISICVPATSHEAV